MTKKQKTKVSPSVSDITDSVPGFLEELRTETDRGAALVAAGFMDCILEVMLRSVFVANARLQTTLLEYPGPLASFASKIDLIDFRKSNGTGMTIYVA